MANLITIGSGSDFIHIDGSKIKNGTDWTDLHDLNVTVGAKDTIDAGDGDDYIRSWEDSVSIYGGDGDDSIFGEGVAVSIDGGDGDDYIPHQGSYARISGGDGDDIIVNYGDYSSLSGGAGNDIIRNDGYHSSIYGGKGNDSLIGIRNGYTTFIHSGGNDTIYGFGSGDTISIESGKVTSSVASGLKVILTTSNNDSITISDTLIQNIVYHDGWIGYQYYEGTSISGSSGSGSSGSGSSGSGSSGSGSSGSGSSGSGSSVSGSSVSGSSVSGSSGSESSGSGSSVSGSSVSGSSVSGSNSTGSSTTSATGSYDSVSNSMISINSATKSATMVMNETDQAYNLTFYNDGTAEKWNATLSGGNDTITIGDIKGGRFDGGDGRDTFNISSSLQGDITLTGGATNDNLESGNNFYAESSSVSIASSQKKITITDVNFNASDVVLIDAGVENLTADFFGNSRFYNYANASDASSSGIYAGTVFNASALVSRLGMSFSMLRMADKSRVTLDNNNSIDENYITNVVWANSYSATIDFSSTQTDEVLIFTNTNSRGDIVSLGGNYNDTIHAGRYDTIDAGGGNDQIYIDNSSAVTIGYSEGDGNDIVYNFTDDDVFSITSDSSYSSMQSGNNMILTIGGNNVTLVGSSDSQTFNIQTTSRYYDVASDSLWGNSDSRESDLLSLTSSDLPENFVTVDEISTQFTDTGLVLTINDSNLNLVGTNLTTFSLAGGRYPADFSNRTFTS